MRSENSNKPTHLGENKNDDRALREWLALIENALIDQTSGEPDQNAALTDALNQARSALRLRLKR